MKVSLIEKFWFQAVALLTFVFFLCLWALNPISNEDLLNGQKDQLTSTSILYKSLITEKLNGVNEEVRFLIRELENNNKDTIDTINTPVKAVFELESSAEQFKLTGNELRSVELAYWGAEDINKEINREFNYENNFIFNEYLTIEAPNGDNFFGQLINKDDKIYFVMLTLYFASDWADSLNGLDDSISVFNSLGDVIYNSEVQYIGSSYPYFDQIDTSQEDSLFRESRSEIRAIASVGEQKIFFDVTASKWEKPYGYVFIIKLLFSLLAIYLLFYLFYRNFEAREQRKIKFNNADMSLNNVDYSKYKEQISALEARNKKLERSIAQQGESIGNQKIETLLGELKAKLANVIGQIQLLKSNPEDTQLLEGLDSKIRGAYKKVYQAIDGDDEEFTIEGAAPPLTEDFINQGETPKNQINYTLSDDIDFYEDSNRIEISEKDFEGLDLREFGEIQDIKPDTSSLTEDTPEAGDELIEQSVNEQLSQQNIQLKTFSIEDDFLQQQKQKILDFENSTDFGSEIKKVDELIESTSKQFKQHSTKNLIRQPRVNK